ncbi:MAG TPA: V-type ATP synthase subunit F [Candidatus Atribacteria bacterium]|nr:V-type ATP synthase subunit F [Candidatus Atribacteria bacterium]HPT78562.1 V-type ATP synthase subunit F [Candidatus Atribacteria bacterium]
MSKIGVIGDRDSILGFKTLGLDIFPVTEPEQAARLVHRLAKENYVVIFMTEAIAKDLGETIERYKTVPYPAIILIPGNQGSMGLGMKGIRENVEKAIGADILFGERG